MKTIETIPVPSDMNIYQVAALPTTRVPDVKNVGPRIAETLSEGGWEVIAGPDIIEDMRTRVRMLVRSSEGHELRIIVEQDLGGIPWNSDKGPVRVPESSYEGQIDQVLSRLPKEPYYGHERSVLPPLKDVHRYEPPERMHLYVRYENLHEIIPEERLEDYRNAYDHASSDNLDRLEEGLIALGTMHSRTRG